MILLIGIRTTIQHANLLHYRAVSSEGRRSYLVSKTGLLWRVAVKEIDVCVCVCVFMCSQHDEHVAYKCILLCYCGLAPEPEWWGAGVVICLERGADLYTAQLMPLPLTVSCFSKIQIGFTLDI